MFPPHLEEGLGEAAALARGDRGDARGFGMEDRGAQAHEADRDEHEGIALRRREGDEAHEGEQHAEGKGVRLRPAVGEGPDKRLEEGGGESDWRG